MNELLREIMAEELGYAFCPIVASYTACDEDCEQCDDYKAFVQCIENREKRSCSNDKNL